MNGRRLIAAGTVMATSVAVLAGVTRVAAQTKTKKVAPYDSDYDVDLLKLLANNVCFLHRSDPGNNHTYMVARYAALAMHETRTRLILDDAPEHTVRRLGEAIADLNEVQGSPRHVLNDDGVSIPYRPSTSG